MNTRAIEGNRVAACAVIKRAAVNHPVAGDIHVIVIGIQGPGVDVYTAVAA